MESRISQWVEQYGASILAFFLLLVLLFRVYRTRPNKLKLPPSPPKLPIIGNLHQLGSLPHRSLRSLAQKHGPVMLLHFGQMPTLVVSSAEAAREILKTQDVCFSNRAKVSFAQRLLYDKDMTFAPYGEYWRQVRRICVLQLLSSQRVESFRPVREEECKIMIEEIRRSSDSSSVVNLTEMLLCFTNDATCRVSLGRAFHGDESSRKKFWNMMAEFMYLLGVFNVEDLIPWLGWINNFNGLNKRLKDNCKELDSFLTNVIEEHIQANKTGESGVGSGVEDFVDVLVSIEKDCSLGVPFDKEGIKAIILDMFSAGTDILSATLVWAMTELIRHPQMKEVQREMRKVGKGKPFMTEDDLGNIPYLKSVLKETLRLHPPAPLLVPRESIESTTLQGYDIPAKTRFIVNAWAIGRDPITWEKPEEFQPRRFLNKHVDYKGADFEMIPFGGGRRGCPGVLFAIPTMELPLANLLYLFDWSLPGNATRREDIDVAESFGILINKTSPLLLVATPHRSK